MFCSARAKSLLPPAFLVAVALLFAAISSRAQRSVTPTLPPSVHSLPGASSGGTQRPLSMAAADFDEDGVADLAIGYASTTGGSIAVLRGNLDAIAPQTHESWVNAGHHQYSNPYSQSTKPIAVAAAPDLLVAADVNGDGHLDLIYASRGATQFFVMLSDGKGNFQNPVASRIPGNITALASYRPGAPLLGEALIVGYTSNQGARLSILGFEGNTLLARAGYALAGTATAIAVGNFDADLTPDMAIVANGDLFLLSGKGAITGQSSLVALPAHDVKAVAAGEFLFDRTPQLQLAVLTSIGDVAILAHQNFDPRPFTPQEVAAVRNASRTRRASQSPSVAQPPTSSDSPWIEIERNSAVAVPRKGSQAPILLRSRFSGSGGDDLIAFDSSQQTPKVISHSQSPLNAASSDARPAPRITAETASFAGGVIAAVSTRVTPDARPGLVLLTDNNPVPQFVLPSAGNTFYVNTTSDNTGTTTDPSGSVGCLEGAAETCTLRDAITLANADAAYNISAGTSDTIMIPEGTYDLTWQAGTLDSNGNAITHLEILGPVTMIGVGTEAGFPLTIVDGQENDVVLTINPGPFGSFNPSGLSYAFDVGLNTLIFQNGKNTSNPATAPTAFSNNTSGCINWDAYGTGNLNLVSSNIYSCEILWGPGGGIWATNTAGGGTGTLTLVDGFIQNNSTPEFGGGIAITEPPVALSVTGTYLSGNVADTSINPSDPQRVGEGGGIHLDPWPGSPSPATPQSVLTGATFYGNVAKENDGGGIYTLSGILVSSTAFTNNHAGRWGGGVFSQVFTPETATTLISNDFEGNFATDAGGAISGGIFPVDAGNILQASLNQIFENGSTNGVGGLAVGAPGESAGEVLATENWWGCNSGPQVVGDGCNQAAVYNSAGILNTSPFVVFKFTADKTTAAIDDPIDLALSINSDSLGNSIAPPFSSFYSDHSYSFTVSGVKATLVPSFGTFNSSGVGTAQLQARSVGSGIVSVMWGSATESSISFTSTPAVATVSPSTLSFGNQTVGVASAAQTSTFTNIGSSTLTILDITTNNNIQSFSQTNNCGTTLAAGASCTFYVTFNPNAAQFKTMTITIHDSGGYHNITANGQGIGGLTVAPKIVAFGSQTVGMTAAQTAVLTNSYSTPVTGISIATSGNTQSFSQTNNCQATLPAGASCQFTVTFDPNGELPKYMTITINDSLGVQTITATGTGAAPSASVSPATLAFGDQAVGSGTEQFATLTNTGAGVLDVSGITVTGNTQSFTVSNSCESTLVAGASCKIYVSFDPNGTVAKSVTITVHDSAGSQMFEATGTGIPSPVSASPLTLNFGNQVVGTTSAPQTSVITNAGPSAFNIGVGLEGNTQSFSQTNNCGSVLAGRSTCTISVVFAPNGASAKSAIIFVETDEGFISINATGTGVAP